jgi:hypothetical protein
MRRLKPATGLWKIHSKRAVTPRKQTIWSMRTNQEFRELYRNLDTAAADIRKQMFEMYRASSTNESWKGS